MEYHTYLNTVRLGYLFLKICIDDGGVKMKNNSDTKQTQKSFNRITVQQKSNPPIPGYKLDPLDFKYI
jgi:hypothetical protein